MSLSGLPFDDIRDLIRQISKIDDQALQLAKNRNDEIATVFGAFGKQALICEWLAGWSGKSPKVSRPVLALFAGTHDVISGLEKIAGEPTLDTVTRLAAGGGAANQACAAGDIGLKVFDLALQYPVADISKQDALDEKGSAATIGFGMEAIAGGIDLLGLGAFGQGSEIANAAIMSILTGEPASSFMSYLDTNLRDLYLPLAEAAIALHGNGTKDPLELLRRIGGREHSAVAGAILAARINHIPVVLDGMTVLAVALLLQKIERNICDHCVIATSYPTPGYRDAIVASRLPVILDDFGLFVDGTASAQAVCLIKTSAAIHSESVLSV